MRHVNLAIETLKQLFLDGWVVTVGLSGKDSFCVSHLATEALQEAVKEVGHNKLGPLYFSTTFTTLDNFELHKFVMDLHEDAVQFGRLHNLPIESAELTPALGSLPMVEYIGRGKLLRTPKTAIRARDCTVDWKIEPMRRFLDGLRRSHQTNKVVSASGTRLAESTTRAANMAKRGDDAYTINETDLGKTISPIKDWSLTDVWSLVSAIENGDIDSYAEDKADGLRRHYSAANGGTCDLFAGENRQADKACGARIGCTLCAMVDEDKSLEGMIATAPHVYGYMQPMADLREFMINTLFDYTHSRSLVGRELKPGGWIKIGWNQYNLEYRKELLRYVLTIDAREAERTGDMPMFQLIDYKVLMMIQYHWAREGGEKEAGEALRIWHEVWTEGRRYDIPKTTLVPKSDLPAYRWLNIADLINTAGAIGVGLEESELQNVSAQAMRIMVDDLPVDCVPFTEELRFDIKTEDGLAWSFIESFFPDTLAKGEWDGLCPSSMLKTMLRAGVLVVKKGSMVRVHREVQRAQVMHAIAKHFGNGLDNCVLFLSVDQATYESKRAEQVTAQNPQQSLFAEDTA